MKMSTKDFDKFIEDNLSDNSTGEIESMIGLLVRQFNRRLDEELKDLEGSIREWNASKQGTDEQATAELMKELTNIASRNRSTWSGGYSTKNMCEEMRRRAALEKLDKLMWRLK